MAVACPETLTADHTVPLTPSRPHTAPFAMSSKCKMVSFRLSADEYTRLRQAANAAGVPSLSELARSAMQRILDAHDGTAPVPLDEQVRGLRARIDSISTELDRLVARLDAPERSL